MDQEFAVWLLRQHHRECWIGDLARAAAKDKRFPRAGAPFDVLDRVRAAMIDGDFAQAVDAAATEWFGDHHWRRDYAEHVAARRVRQATARVRKRAA